MITTILWLLAWPMKLGCLKNIKKLRKLYLDRYVIAIFVQKIHCIATYDKVVITQPMNKLAFPLHNSLEDTKKEAKFHRAINKSPINA